MSRNKEEAPVRKRKRKSQGPLGGFNAKLSIPKGLVPDDKMPRWVNDVDNRLQTFLDNDYEFVQAKEGMKIGDTGTDGNTDIGSKISKVVGTTKTNEPMRAYLMMIDRDWYEEDQAEKQVKVDNIDRAIRSPGFGADTKGLDKNHTYGKIDYKA